MSELVAAAIAVGAAYGAVGASVAVVAVATRTLHLAVGQILVAGVLVHLLLTSPVVGVPAPLALLAALAVGALLSAALGPLVLDRLTDARSEVGEGPLPLLGLVVAAGLLEVAVVRTVGARPLTASPLLDLPALGPLPGATVVALAVGVPLVLLAGAAVGRGRTGATVRVTGGAPTAAAAAGRDPAWVRAAALAGAGAVAVVAGLLAAPLVTTGTAQATGLTVRAVAAALLLGGGRPARALPAGMLLGAAEVAGATWWPAAGAEVVVAAVVVLTLVVRGDDQRRAWGRAW